MKNPGNLNDIRICAEEIIECSGFSREQFALQGPVLLATRLETVAIMARDILQTLDAYEARLLVAANER